MQGKVVPRSSQPVVPTQADPHAEADLVGLAVVAFRRRAGVSGRPTTRLENASRPLASNGTPSPEAIQVRLAPTPGSGRKR